MHFSAKRDIPETLLSVSLSCLQRWGTAVRYYESNYTDWRTNLSRVVALLSPKIVYLVQGKHPPFLWLLPLSMPSPVCYAGWL